jgi:CubicO group peptidase (beta-lactamase class C family)
MSAEPALHGRCDPRFEGVRQVFAENFRTRREVGAAVAVVVDGAPVVDLFGGFADQARTRPWERDTIANVYSTTKGVAAICAHRLVDEGKLDLDAPVRRYWPEFAAQGKGEIPVRWLLSHRAGLPAVRKLLPADALYDDDAMAAALAAEAPWWEPGTTHGYHALTYGWLVGEVVRRASGVSLGRFFQQRFAEPLGLDFHIGLPAREHGRVAEMSPLGPPAPEDLAQGGDEAVALAQLMMGDPEGMVARAFLNPPLPAPGTDLSAWRSAEIPAANGHGSARALAQLYGALARDDGRVLGRESLARCHTEESFGPDAVLRVTTRFSTGFMLPQDRPETSFGSSPRAFGHPGAGGSVGFADPDARVGFGYVMNRMGPRILLDPRTVALIGAVYDALG